MYSADRPRERPAVAARRRPPGRPRRRGRAVLAARRPAGRRRRAARAAPGPHARRGGPHRAAPSFPARWLAEAGGHPRRAGLVAPGPTARRATAPWSAAACSPTRSPGAMLAAEDRAVTTTSAIPRSIRTPPTWSWSARRPPNPTGCSPARPHGRRPAHLVVRAEPERVVVGPFVVPGSGRLRPCTDLVRRDLDRDWPHLLAQLCRSRHTPAPRQAAWAAALASAQLAAWLAGRTPEASGATWELDAHTGGVGVTRWPRHPDCGCGAVGDMPGGRRRCARQDARPARRAVPRRSARAWRGRRRRSRTARRARPGIRSAMAISVASVKTTNAGMDAASASALRQARSASHSGLVVGGRAVGVPAQLALGAAGQPAAADAAGALPAPSRAGGAGGRTPRRARTGAAATIPSRNRLGLRRCPPPLRVTDHERRRCSRARVTPT